MRLVIQRVNKASVSVEGKIVGEISKGLIVLIGIKKGDSEKDAIDLAQKLSKLRVMSDNNQKMNLSVKDVNADVLLISQFTLFADTTGGNRPSFIGAAEPKFAIKLYEIFIIELKKLGVNIKTGKFGEYMNINCELDGPVTILIDSKN